VLPEIVFIKTDSLEPRFLPFSPHFPRPLFGSQKALAPHFLPTFKLKQGVFK
jgi:hypothetical protein